MNKLPYSNNNYIHEADQYQDDEDLADQIPNEDTV